MMGGASIGLQPGVFMQRGFLGNKGIGCIRWMQKPQLTIFWVAVIANLAARRQIPVPWSSISELYHMRPGLPCFVSTTHPASSFLAVNAESGRLS